MLVKIKKLDSNAKLPTKGTTGSTCFDVYALEDSWIGRGVTKVRTGLAFEIPQGYEMEIRPRSGLSSKESLIIVNSPGTLDSDFRGELVILMTSLKHSPVENTFPVHEYEIKAGDRVAQFKINEVLPVEFKEVEELSQTERGTGGYGSTGR